MSVDLTKLQEIICYVNADSPVGVITDSSAQSLTGAGATQPMIVRGIDAMLCLRLLQNGAKYPASKLAYDTWACSFANDWKDSTDPLIEADNDNIELVDETDYTELRIPVLVSNTADLISAITDKASVDLGLELTGYVAGDEEAKFALQFDVTIRNRRNMTGQAPDEPLETYWTITQTKAWVAMAPDFQFSVDGATLWHDTQVAADRYYRESRNGGEWSEAIALIDNSDFSGYGTKAALVDDDTLLENDSENSGNPIVVTMLKIWNYINTKAASVYAAISHSHAISDVTSLSDALDGKEDSLGFTPENSANKGLANGYASLDANGKLPASQQNDNSVTRVVADIAARDALTDMVEGTECWVTDASADATVTLGAAKYLYSGSAWIKTAEAESMDVITAWENVTSKPQVITEIASITGADNDIIQKVSGSWINRTMAQLKTALGLTSSDVGLGNVTNESKTTMFTNPAFTGSITTPVIKPASDSASAIKMQNAAGTSDIVTVDTSNEKISIVSSSNDVLSVTNSSGTYTLIGTTLSASGNIIIHSGGYVSFQTTAGDFEFKRGGLPLIYGSSTGVGIYGILTPTAALHLPAGLAAAGKAPLKITLTSAALLTSPEPGALEADSSGNLYFTNSSAVRDQIITSDGLIIREGTNCTMGTATLVAGTATINTTKVTANSRIMLTTQSLGTVSTPAAIAVTARTAGTSFTITSADGTDTSVIAWQIIEPLT